MHNRFHKSCEENNFNMRAMELYLITEMVAVMKTVLCIDAAMQANAAPRSIN